MCGNMSARIESVSAEWGLKVGGEAILKDYVTKLGPQMLSNNRLTP